jgi:competence protein ComEC
MRRRGRGGFSTVVIAIIAIIALIVFFGGNIGDLLSGAGIGFSSRNNEDDLPVGMENLDRPTWTIPQTPGSNNLWERIECLADPNCTRETGLQERPPAELPEEISEPFEELLTIYFLDVGQGDATFIEVGGYTMLIDGGPGGASSFLYSFLEQKGITNLDYIILSHAHEDHVGGLSGALERASATRVYSAHTSSASRGVNTRAFRSFTDRVGSQIVVPEVGYSFMMGDAYVLFLNSYGSVQGNTSPNDDSLVIKIIHGNNAFVITGDVERPGENFMIERWDLDSMFERFTTVLRVAHHGSSSSTIYPFLRALMPEYGIISVGAGNRYNHPTDAVLSRLRDADVQVFRTDQRGTITMISDGMTLEITTEKG